MDEDLKIGSIIKKLFGLEQKELILLLFFLAIFIFCIYSLIIILIEEKNLFKQLKKYKIIEKHKQEIFLILILPIIFLIMVCFGLIKFDSWIGFFGGYFGVLGAIGAIWYQKSLDNEAAINGIELYTNYIVENLSKKFEENYMSFLTVFTTLNGYDKIYSIEEIAKRKKDFNIINTDIITSNLSIILSNKKFITLLSLKEKLDNLNYYIVKLEEDNSKGNIYEPLMKDLDNLLKNDKNTNKIAENFSEKIKELTFLSSVLLRLNVDYYGKSLQFKEEEIIPKYKFLVQNIKEAFNNKKNINILQCYIQCITNIAEIILFFNGNLRMKKLEYYYYLRNTLNLINIMIGICEDIEKLKSTNQ